MNIIKQIRVFIFIAVLLTGIFGCAFNGLNPKKYIKWVENESNGLKVSKKINHFIYQVQYKPVQYIAIREALSEGKINNDIINKKLRELGQYYYFTVQISSEDGKTPMLKYNLKSTGEYYQRLNYFVSYAQSDFTLLNGYDTIPCTLYHFEENYNLTPFNRMVIGFENPNNKAVMKDLTLIFNDNILNTGIVEFTIESKKIKKIPKLKI